MKQAFLLLAALTLVGAACSSASPTATAFPSATVSPLPADSATPTLPWTPSLPAATPTLPLAGGTLSTRVNVRSGPGTSYDSLGQLNAGEDVQVVVRSSDGAWYQILYTPAAQGRGWVAAQFITLEAGVQVPLEATPTPTGPSGRLTLRLNVRSGPGVSFDVLGLLEAESIVSLSGKNSTASWFQIDYPSGPGGHGWVTAQYIQTDASAVLPVLDDYGNPVTPGTQGATLIPMTPTATIGPAVADGDSSSNPAVRVTFSSTGTHLLTYSSQVSVPEGDADDWVEFTPYAATGTQAQLTFSLSCSGNGVLKVDLWQGGASLTDWGSLACGDAAKTISLTAGIPYLVHLTPVAGASLQLVQYWLTVRNWP